jgi:hypothetical protein
LIRISELALPLDHTSVELEGAVARRLGVSPGEIRSLTIFKRSSDARSRRTIRLVYIVDVEQPERRGTDVEAVAADRDSVGASRQLEHTLAAVFVGIGVVE